MVDDDYLEYMNSPEWKEKRDEIMAENEFICQKCGCMANHVHHLTYKNFGNESREDLMCLCKECHEEEHEGNWI
jgi:5-methylcytosine-specific restriction endonuclease McrA|tara:strand:- start:13 stop:234 length:222 start_codon:yes stop_codon:yes gene_type:complete